MKKTFLAPDFFLASHSSEGFFSIFNKLYFPEENWFCYILKGGPGTGKSTLMKEIVKKAQKKKIKYELIHCSSDPKSLDAVIFPELKKCIADGTAPHTLDPIYPGASDVIINLGECWNTESLKKSKKEIINLCKENSKYHKKAANYLKAYGNIEKQKSNEFINQEKLEQYTFRLTKKIFGSKISYTKGKETKRLIRAVTPDGYVFFENTLYCYANKIYLIDDEFKKIGNYIFENIRKKATEKGLDIILCPSAILGENYKDAIIIPKLGIAFAMTDKNCFKNKEKNIIYKKINAKRFLNTDVILKHKNMLKFNLKAQKVFLEEITNNLQKALKIHDKIENKYISAMDFKKAKKITDKLISDIL